MTTAEVIAVQKVVEEQQLVRLLHSFQQGNESAMRDIYYSGSVAKEVADLIEFLAGNTGGCYSEVQVIPESDVVALIDDSFYRALYAWQEGQSFEDTLFFITMASFERTAHYLQTRKTTAETLAELLQWLGLKGDCLEQFRQSLPRIGSVYYDLLTADLLVIVDSPDWAGSLEELGNYLPNVVQAAAWREFREYCKNQGYNVAYFPQV